MQRLQLVSLPFLCSLALALALPACNGDDGQEGANETQGDGDGDPGDGDPGDGDGEPGDGDGEPGDGDGEPGDGDGEPGDGDGEPGDGDGEPGDGDGEPGDGDGDVGLTFTADVHPIIMANCGCHGGGSGGLTMTDAQTAYDNLVDVPAVHDRTIDRIEPGDPGNSFLYQKITATHDGISPTNAQMPKTQGQAMSNNPLPAQDQQTIADWITAGAVF